MFKRQSLFRYAAGKIFCGIIAGDHQVSKKGTKLEPLSLKRGNKTPSRHWMAIALNQYNGNSRAKSWFLLSLTKTFEVKGFFRLPSLLSFAARR